jgi:hypothetical protein
MLIPKFAAGVKGLKLLDKNLRDQTGGEITGHEVKVLDVR